jgi:hypothetical protein
MSPSAAFLRTIIAGIFGGWQNNVNESGPNGVGLLSYFRVCRRKDDPTGCADRLPPHSAHHRRGRLSKMGAIVN